MRISYDNASHGLFIILADRSSERSEDVAPGIVVDYDAEGKPVAIEVEDVRPFGGLGELKVFVESNALVGADLRSFRERLDLTQEEFGDRLEIPRNTIARWERGDMPIEKNRLLSLAMQALLLRERPKRDTASEARFGEKRAKFDTVKKKPKTSVSRRRKKQA